MQSTLNACRIASDAFFDQTDYLLIIFCQILHTLMAVKMALSNNMFGLCGVLELFSFGWNWLGRMIQHFGFAHTHDYSYEWYIGAVIFLDTKPVDCLSGSTFDCCSCWSAVSCFCMFVFSNRWNGSRGRWLFAVTFFRSDASFAYYFAFFRARFGLIWRITPHTH